MSANKKICIYLGSKGACTLNMVDVERRLARNRDDIKMSPEDHNLLNQIMRDEQLVRRGHADLADWRQATLLCTAILQTRRFTTRRVLDGNISPNEIDKMATCDGHRPRLNG